MKEISRNELKQLIDSKGSYLLIDVREMNEMVHGKIPTAQNLPLSEFTAALELSEEEFQKKYSFSMSKRDRIIFYCRSGSRSAKATEAATDKGFNAENYKGSILDWAEIDEQVEKY